MLVIVGDEGLNKDVIGVFVYEQRRRELFKIPQIQNVSLSHAV